MEQRKPWVAFLFSLLVPGLGQFYNGERRKSLGFIIAFAAVFPALALGGGTYLGAVAVVCYFAIFYLSNLIDAFRTARRRKEYAPQTVNRRWHYVLFAIVVYSGVKIEQRYVRANYFEAFKIPSFAMEPTLIPGDRIMTDRSHYRHSEPARGDIAVFTMPNDPDTNIVKRVVGIPGDTVELRGTELFLNGELVSETFTKYTAGGRKNFGPAQVPSGKVLLFGDNRDQSKDSRHFTNFAGEAEPFVDIARLKGKVIYIYLNPYTSGRHGITFK